MPDRDVLRAAVDAYLDGLSRNDGAAIMALFADEARLEDPIGNEPRVGREAISAFYAVPRAITMVKRLGPLTVHKGHVGFQFRVRIEGERTAGPAQQEASVIEISITEILGFDDEGKIISMLGVPDFESRNEGVDGREFPLQSLSGS